LFGIVESPFVGVHGTQILSARSHGAATSSKPRALGRTLQPRDRTAAALGPVDVAAFKAARTLTKLATSSAAHCAQLS
jgi:hypothetical protein